MVRFCRRVLQGPQPAFQYLALSDTTVVVADFNGIERVENKEVIEYRWNFAHGSVVEIISASIS